MHRKPIIGINSDFRPSRNDSPALSYLFSGYYDSILAAGGIPVIVPPLEEEDDLDQVLEGLDGFLLIGGNDLDPRADGFMLHPTVRPMNSRREQFDRLLVSKIADLKMPVFGIGVGMQLLNVSQGGNLALHIPEDFPDSLAHVDSQDVNHRHGLTVVPGTLMERVYGDGEIRVNSLHHQAVDDLAPCFSVTARCPDGIVEAFESHPNGDWFVVGTQFHPEASSASALDIRIFEEFIDGVRLSQQQSTAVPMIA